MPKVISATAVAVIMLALAPGAFADPWKDESGHGHYGYANSYEVKEGKIERYENGCKIEEKFDGGYKKEVKCDSHIAWRHGPSYGEGAQRPPAGPPLVLLPDEKTTWQAGQYPPGTLTGHPEPREATAGAIAQTGYCREYTSTAVVNGVPQQTYGQACLQPDGSWKIVQ